MSVVTLSPTSLWTNKRASNVRMPPSTDCFQIKAGQKLFPYRLSRLSRERDLTSSDSLSGTASHETKDLCCGLEVKHFLGSGVITEQFVKI